MAKQLTIELNLSDGSSIKLQISSDKMTRQFTLNGKRSSNKELRFHLSKLGINMNSENPTFLIQQNTITQIPQFTPTQLAELIADANGSLTFRSKTHEAYQKLVNWEQTEIVMKENMGKIEKQFEEWSKYELLVKQEEALVVKMRNVEKQIHRIDFEQREMELEALKEKKCGMHALREIMVEKMHAATEEISCLTDELHKKEQMMRDIAREEDTNELRRMKTEFYKVEQKLAIVSKEIREMQKKRTQIEMQLDNVSKKLQEMRILEATARAQGEGITDKLTVQQRQHLERQLKDHSKNVSDMENMETQLSNKMHQCNESILRLECIMNGSLDRSYLLQLETDLLQVNLSMKKTSFKHLTLPSSLKRMKNIIDYALNCFTWKNSEVERGSQIVEALSYVCDSKASTIIAESSSKAKDLVDNLKSVFNATKYVWCLDRIRFSDLQKKQRIFEAIVAKSGVPCAAIAVDLVQCDPKFQPVVLKFFGQIAVCFKDSDAHTLSKDLPFGVIVSADEHNVHYAKGGSVRGGFPKNSLQTLLLFQKYQHQLHELSLEKQIRKKEFLVQEIENVKALHKVRLERSQLESQVNLVQKQICEQRQAIAGLTAQLAPVKDEFEPMEYYVGEIAQLEDQIELMKEEIGRDEEKSQTLSRKKHELALKRGILEGTLRQLEISRDAHEKKRDELQVEIQHSHDRIAELATQTDELREEKQDLSRAMESLQLRIEEVSDIFNELIDENDILEVTNTRNLDHHSHSLDSLQKSLKLMQLQLSDLQRDIDEKQAELGTKLDLSHLSRTWDQIKESFTILQKESRDLKEFIIKAEEQVRLANLQAFSSIAQLFSRYVSQLLPGKTGTLEAVNATDISKGVNFQVKEGKEVCTLSQLSGGQKSLLATCFIFAIGAQHGSPFFLLDEIDAALDENNQNRLSRFLRQFSASGQQLIFVSHHANSQRMAQRVIRVDMEVNGNISREQHSVAEMRDK